MNDKETRSSYHPHSAFAFWSSLGWQEIDRRPDLQFNRPCVVMHKPLS
ncbi:hypothetical protein [Streptomyces sp. NPDC002516]